MLNALPTLGWQLLVVVGLTACTPVAIVPEAPPPAPVQPVSVPIPQVSTVDEDVRHLLEAAERALAADHLTSPIHDNAYDRYQAVLLLRPNHPQALSGLQQVLLRYLALARQEAARSEYGKARALLERARLVDKDNPQVAALTREVARQQARQQRGPQSEKEFPLAPELLDKRDQQIVGQLGDIARKASRSGETLLIVARADAEGRWIYRQMKQAVPGFRLRGDIKLGKKAKVLLLPPID